MTEFFEHTTAEDMEVPSKIAAAMKHLLGACMDNEIPSIKGYFSGEDMGNGCLLGSQRLVHFVAYADADGRSMLHVSVCMEGSSKYQNQYCLWDSKRGTIICLDALLCKHSFEEMDEAYCAAVSRLDVIGF